MFILYVVDKQLTFKQIIINNREGTFMESTMRAAFVKAPFNIELREVPVPEVQED